MKLLGRDAMKRVGTRDGGLTTAKQKLRTYSDSDEHSENPK